MVKKKGSLEGPTQQESGVLASVKEHIFNPHKPLLMMCVLILAECVINLVVIWKVKYTEIDWIAYMQEVEGVMNGTYDYTQLKGDTGPLVYPAGFVYLFMGLYNVTSHGEDIRLAQYIYAGLYILTLLLIFNIYRKVSKIPPWVLIFMSCTSYRIHSIYVLRLFNDPVAMIFLYAAVNFLLYDHWLLGCVFYSLGVSVKMNVLLFAPGLLILLLRRHGFAKTVGLLFVCAVIQLALGAPFLLNNPVGYIMGAFNLGRQFLYEWTVNWRFIPEEVFTSRYFHGALLCGHIATLSVYYHQQWSHLFTDGILSVFGKHGKKIQSNDIVKTLFVCNLIGMSFSRSLHYQFYIWYYHTLHYIVWCIRMSPINKLLLLGAIELCWNTYPSTVYSSGCLHGCHAAILLGLLLPKLSKQELAAEKIQ